MVKTKKKLQKKMQWYVASILPKSENKILNFIENDDQCIKYNVEGWYPKREVIAVKKGNKAIIKEPLYPNYMLFLLPSTNKDIHKRLKTSQYIIGFLTDKETGKLCPLSSQEVAHTKKLCEKIEKIDYINKILGKRVYINKGPYRGMIGDCTRIFLGKYTARVNIDMLGEGFVNAEINLDYLEEYIIYGG
jgi:transcription antitermination factor NusG